MFISCSDGDDSNKSQTVSVTGITVSPESTTLYVDPTGVDGGKSEISLTAKVSPDNATNKAVTWTLSDGYDSIVTLTGKLTDSSITLKAKAAGTITASAKTSDGGKTATSTITVLEKAETAKTTSVTLKKGDESIGTFDTIAKALAAIPSSAGESDTYTILLAPDTYSENALRYAGKANLVIAGNTTKQFGSDVIIAGKGSSQSSMDSRCLFSVTGTANLTLKNVTFKNTTKRAEVTEKDAKGNLLTQAEALSFFSTGKLTAYNSGFYSHQDTLYTRGRAWFYKCYAEGDVDFLWMSGDAKVALYEDCTIKMTAEESPSAAYIAAPGLPESSPVGKGLVIMNSKILADSALNGAAYLTRTPWSSGYYSQAAYVNCTFEGNINKNIWYGSAIEEGIDDDNVGWKMDSATATALQTLGCDTSKVKIMSDRITKREYNGRYTVLNRVFNTNSKKWENLSEKWDAAAGLTVNTGDSIADDPSKKNIFVDYADISKTTIGSALTVNSYEGAVSGAEWKTEVFSDINMTSASSESVSVDANGLTSTSSTKNIYIKVSATKDGASDYVILFSVKATAISLSDTAISLAEGSEKQLTATFKPEGASAEVEWTSSDPTIATVDEKGLVKALAGQKGKSTVIKASVKDNAELTASCTVTVTEACILKKFGQSVATLENFNDYNTFGASDVLIYPVKVDASTSATATYEISAKITYSAVANGGAGFVSFKDGAYSDGAMRSYAWATPAGVKSYDGNSTRGQGYDKDYKTYANAAGVYTVKAYTKKDGNLYFSLTNSDGVEMIKYSASSYYVPSSSDYIYLAIGGAAGISVSASDITITITDSEGNASSMKVAKFEDLAADTRTATTCGDVTASLTLSADAYSSVKGASETIVMEKVAVPTTSASTNGSWIWDATTLTYSGSGNLSTTASFIPEDRTTYKAILSKEVTITVTDNRNEGKQFVYNVVSESFAATGDLQNSVDNTCYGDGTHGNMVVDTLTYNNTTEKEGGSDATGKVSKGAANHQTRNAVFYIPVDTSRISDSNKASIAITIKDGANWNNSNVYGGANDAAHKLTDASGVITYTFSTGDLVTKASETSAGTNASVTAALDEAKSYAKIIIRHNGGDSYFKSITLTYTDN
ncbi:MAG: Ig-like domain-containing protein [Treponema sp.]|nr:Ig-like domain-containing protein [Treponema sp.]